jgi:hypothetical protein
MTSGAINFISPPLQFCVYSENLHSGRLLNIRKGVKNLTSELRDQLKSEIMECNPEDAEKIPNYTVIYVNNALSTESRTSSLQFCVYSGDGDSRKTLNMKEGVKNLTPQLRAQLNSAIMDAEELEIENIRKSTKCCYISKRHGCIVSSNLILGSCVCIIGTVFFIALPLVIIHPK